MVYTVVRQVAGKGMIVGLGPYDEPSGFDNGMKTIIRNACALGTIESNVYLNPSYQSSIEKSPGTVKYELTVYNNTGKEDNFNITYQNKDLIASGPAVSGIIPHGSSVVFTVSVELPEKSFNLHSFTTMVSAISTTDSSMSNSAVIVTKTSFSNNPEESISGPMIIPPLPACLILPGPNRVAPSAVTPPKTLFFPKILPNISTFPRPFCKVTITAFEAGPF